ncbi:type IV toxin-antitoxin system AbiEi family antitoxin domain-containing protein [Acetobacterium malicum]|uniref:type IV toxin-antitoxin system AbiEi family antitoxin domain-containing protein n=1 Tax=Acetobacterium malicum TaxID=52692 RepID=UPI000409B1BA|nr:type IV toxin-antitoxin system AbiEi family antitoxin domain-containing protein [Acetobacterium dehalogenans]
MLCNENIQEIINKHNGFITASQVTAANIPRRCLTELVNKNELYKISRGIYARPDVWEDELYILQYRYNKGIFSHETALYLHRMSDRTPSKFNMTFPHGYHASSLSTENVIIKRVIPDIYELGITSLKSPWGNTLRVYDIERTLCDIVKGNNTTDIQIVNQAMKTYAGSKTKNINKLMDVAEKLRVKPKILNNMEVLL